MEGRRSSVLTPNCRANRIELHRIRKSGCLKESGQSCLSAGLSFFTTKEQLKSLFSPFGAVTEARLVMDPRTKRPKGFGFVSYESEIEAQKAMKAMNGRIVDGRLIFVDPAEKGHAS